MRCVSDRLRHLIQHMPVSTYVSCIRVPAAGIIIAAVVSGRSDHLVSECAWYFVAFLLDTSLGVALAIALHSAAVKVARARAAANSFAAIVADCGNYGKHLCSCFPFTAIACLCRQN